jgi:hypothetical protein
MILLDAIIETNAVTIVLLADGSLLTRINGNIRPLSHVAHLIDMDALRTSRGPITA